MRVCVYLHESRNEKYADRYLNRPSRLKLIRFNPINGVLADCLSKKLFIIERFSQRYFVGFFLKPS